MQVQEEGGRIIWNYERLWVIGCLGSSRLTLDKIPELYVCKYGKDGIEFGRPDYSGNREFMAVFHFFPHIDATLVRLPHSEISIVTYSLDKQESGRLIDRLADVAELASNLPNSEFRETIGREIATVEVANYNLARKINALAGIDFETAFALPRYVNFLFRYKGMNTEMAVAEAGKKLLRSV
jgi:hypothetical protein